MGFSAHITFIYMVVRSRRVSVKYTYFHYLDVTGWNVWAHPAADAHIAAVLFTVNQRAVADHTAFKLIDALLYVL
jgi:hypothetical protein